MDSTLGWMGFNLFIITALILDLLILHRSNKSISLKNSLWMSAGWVSLALLFNLGIFIFKGKEDGLNFLAGYLIEESLSVDNLFVFVMLFNHFHTPAKYQYKVLFWGILGAIIMRACMIFFGIALVRNFYWILYLFGLFLIFAGVKMALPQKKIVDEVPENIVLRLLKRLLPISKHYDNGHFFTNIDGRWFATPLFVVLIMVETTDLIFALDSIPAVMAITLDPFIIYTSNIFAVLGLRSLYFALAALLPIFHFLHYALSVILIFVGLKMLLGHWIHIPIGLSLALIIFSLATAIILSLLFPQKHKDKK